MMHRYWISCLIAIISGLSASSGLWMLTRSVLTQSGTLSAWLGRVAGIIGLGTALWLAGRDGFVTIIVAFFASALAGLGLALLARKWRMS